MPKRNSGRSSYDWGYCPPIIPGELEEAQAILQGQLDELREGGGDSDSDGSGDSN